MVSEFFYPPTYIVYIMAHKCAGGLKKNIDLPSGFHSIDINLSIVLRCGGFEYIVHSDIVYAVSGIYHLPTSIYM